MTDYLSGRTRAAGRIEIPGPRAEPPPDTPVADWRLIPWAAAVFAAGAALLQFRPGQSPAVPWTVLLGADLLTLLTAALTGAAVRTVFAENRARRPGWWRPEGPEHDPFRANGPRPNGTAAQECLGGAEIAAAAPAPPPDDATALQPPRFGRGSKAHARPWLLPPRPVQSGTSADGARIGALDVRAASVVGPGHRCEEPAQPRQDAYRLARDTSGEHLVIAVADGISNSPYSDLGATVACTTAVQVLREQLNRGASVPCLVAADVFSAVAARIRTAAAGRGLGDRDVATVLLTAVIPAQVRGDAQMWVGRIGDASVWRLDGEVWAPAVGGDKEGDSGIESHSVVHSLPSGPQEARSTRLPVRAGEVLTFATDGIGDALAGLPAVNRYLARRWTRPPSVAGYLNDLDYDAKTFLDDRSAVSVWFAEDRGHA